MPKAFATFLANDSFFPGVLALYQSLRESGNVNFPFVVLTDEAVSNETLAMLSKLPIQIKTVKKIKPPITLENDFRNYKCMFTKLRIFEMDEFQKIVYLDSDMIVCHRIEELFDRPHMSAVVAGSILPCNYSWMDLNAGLLVVEPDLKLFRDMYRSLYVLPTKDGSDQGFLHSFYPQWKFRKALHLEHRFNVPCAYLDYYCKYFDFKFKFLSGKLSIRNVSIIHFWGKQKPWNEPKIRISENPSLYQQAISLWWYWYGKIKFKIEW